VPIPLGDESIKHAMEMKRSVERDRLVFPHRAVGKISEIAPTDEQIQKAQEVLKEANGNAPTSLGDEPTVEHLGLSDPTEAHPKIAFEGMLPSQVENLSRKLRFLGGEVVEGVNACSHLVVPNLERTETLVEAIAHGRWVVSSQWIEQSFSLLKFIDSFDFLIHDPDNERKFCFNLKASTLRAQHRRVFEGVTFHLSESVRPSFAVLQRLVEAAGGKVEKTLPKRAKLARCIEVDETYLIVVCENDLHRYDYLLKCNFPLFNEEFIFSAILRHQIDISPVFRVQPPLPAIHPSFKNGNTVGGPQIPKTESLMRNGVGKPTKVKAERIKAV